MKDPKVKKKRITVPFHIVKRLNCGVMVTKILGKDIEVPNGAQLLPEEEEI